MSPGSHRKLELLTSWLSSQNGDVGLQSLGSSGDAGDEATTRHAHDDGIQLALHLVQ